MATTKPTKLKFILDGETRRIRVGDISTLTFDKLSQMAEASFPLSNSFEKKIFYFDDEEDKVVIRNDDDLEEAVAVMKEDMGLKTLKFLIEVGVEKTTAAAVAAAVLAVPTPVATVPEIKPVVEDVAVDEKEYVPLSARAPVAPVASSISTAAPDTTPKETTAEASDKDGLEALLSLFNMEMFAPLARDVLSMFENSGDEKAIYLASLVQNPEFTEVVAGVRTSEAGSTLFSKIEEKIQSGVPPMFVIHGYVEDGTMKTVLQPIFDKFPELLTHFPMLNRIIDPETAGAFGGDGCPMRPGMMAGMMPGMMAGMIPGMMPGMMPGMTRGMMGMCGMSRMRRGGHCGFKKKTSTATTTKPETNTPAPVVPDAATREILRNEKAINDAIAASLASLADDLNAADAEAEAVKGDEEHKEGDTTPGSLVLEEGEVEVEATVETPLDLAASFDSEESYEAIPSMSEKFADQLSMLHNMGFMDDVRNIALLQEKDGNLRNVVEVYFM